MMHESNFAPVPRLDEIRAVTMAYFGLTKADMVSPCRARRVARPRQIAMALTREMTKLSLPKIGKRYGGRDHTTVLWACRRIRRLEDDNPKVALDVERIRQAVYRFIQPDQGERPEALKAEAFMASIAEDVLALAAIFGEARALEISNRNARAAHIARHRQPVRIAA